MIAFTRVPGSNSKWSTASPSLRLRKEACREINIIRRSSSPDSPEPQATATPPPGTPEVQDGSPGNNSNAAIAFASVAVGMAFFLFSRGDQGTIAAIERDAVDFDMAVGSGRPTIVEFYADWCQVCKQLAPTAYEIQQQYKGNVNYSLVNVDNPKWAPELAEYSVTGVPEFVFLDSRGKAVAAAAGKVPAEVLKADAAALSIGTPLPYAAVTNEGVSSVADRRPAIRQANPLDHN